ncbi:MAG: HD domain-containing protein [Pseudomonadota bacterium]
MTSNWTQDIFVKAWDFATLAHHGQTYGGPVEGQKFDYINHIGSVAMELIWALNNTPEADGNLAIQCALLHDTLEDTKITYEEVVSMFGQDVAEGVRALTKNESLATKHEQMLDSLQRIKKQPVEVWMVKLADRITNLSAPPFYWSREKKISYREEALIIHEELHTANMFLSERLLSRIESYQNYIKKF